MTNDNTSTNLANITKTVQQLEDKISKLESALDKIANGTQPYNEREAFIFVDIAKQIASEALS